MEGRFQFGTVDILRLTLWIAIACFVTRFVFIDLGLRPQLVTGIAAVLAFVLTPFVAAGAMFDRMGLGILCGLALMAAFAMFSLGAG